MSTPAPTEGTNPSPHPMDPTQPLPGSYPPLAPAPPVAMPAPSAQQYLAMLNQNLRLTQSGMIYRDPQTLGKRPLPNTELSEDEDEDEYPRRKHKLGVDKAIETMDRRFQRDERLAEEIMSSSQDDQPVTQQEVDRLLQSISLDGYDAVGDLDQCVMV